ncbi:cell division cycle-associated protein 7-like isoform X2 [Micropterus dolomieu]|uniref:cell division cycle-associated protein 7-like isoform X2 n=1 Tax=Micropterus dolomieu TaxID=147949 RepID=UPI001E8D76B8|nr:cell division cycle-associated protein 7-like isoform X2 [Micropterus dolomieu]
MAGVLGMQSFTKELTLADVFAEDSENERTFYGFSDSELSDHCNENSNLEDEAQPDLFPKEQKATSKPSSGSQTFKLRVALCSTASTMHSSDDEGAEEEEKMTKQRGVKKAGKTSGAKLVKHVKFEDEETPVAPEESGSDSAEDVSDSFLAKRQQNIKANKAMLAQLMADLYKMPGGAGLLKKKAGKQKTKERSSRPPCSGAAGRGRKNPERVTRRQTRSMGGGADPSAPKEEELELSLEEELLEVRRAPQRRGAPRPNQCKPHFIRPVEDITEAELQLVADNMTEKVYNRVTGSTCHQCRQKTVDTKTCCRSEDCRGIQGQFCGPCLRNRYGEDVKKALLDLVGLLTRTLHLCRCTLFQYLMIGSALPVVAFATAASAASVRAAARLASCSLWLSTTASRTSTPTSAASVTN